MRTLRLFCFYFSPSARWTIEQSTLSWCLNCGISVFFFLSDAKRHSANSSPFLLKQNSKKYAHVSNELFAVCAPLLAVRWSFFFRHTVANARDSQNEFRPQPNTFSLPLLALSLCAFILSALLYLHIKSWYIPAEFLPAIRSKQCFCSAPFYTPSLTEYHLFCNWHFLFCFFGAWVSKEWGGEIQIYGCAYRNL